MAEPLPEYLVVGDGLRTLVFLHGLGGDHNNWHPQIASFAPDYRCIAWTLPGYGVSPAIDALTWPNLSDTVARVLDDVGVDTATVVGLSMGGYIAQQFAADHDDRVDRLVLAATSSHFGRGSKSFAERFLAARLEPIDNGDTPADLAPQIIRGLLRDDAPAGAQANAIASMSQISSDAYREALRCLVTWNFTDYLDEITARTLCIAGADDTTAPVAAMETLAEGLPDARLEVIANCKHLVNLDQPDEFNRVVRAFLEER